MSTIAFKCVYCHCKFVISHKDYARKAMLDRCICPYCLADKLTEIPFRAKASIGQMLTEDTI